MLEFLSIFEESQYLTPTLHSPQSFSLSLIKTRRNHSRNDSPQLRRKCQYMLSCLPASPQIFDLWRSGSVWHIEGGEKTRTNIPKRNSCTGTQKPANMQVTVTHLSFGLIKRMKPHPVSHQPLLALTKSNVINRKINFAPSSTSRIRILEKMRLQIIHVRSCELVT